MKPLRVDMIGLMGAFEDASWATKYYLDRETGEVLMFMDDDFLYIDEPPDWPLPEWQQERIKKAEEVWLDRGIRYLDVPQADSRQAYRDMDLTPLAAAARRLSGHLQSQNLGADVFLADPQSNYLGRTCPWKRCGPGIRMGCDARHCGQRLYLHDDWDAVRLENKVVRRPPIILWPKAWYSAEEVFEDQVVEYQMTCTACGVQITSHDPHLTYCPWCGAEMTTGEEPYEPS